MHIHLKTGDNSIKNSTLSKTPWTFLMKIPLSDIWDSDLLIGQFSFLYSHHTYWTVLSYSQATICSSFSSLYIPQFPVRKVMLATTPCSFLRLNFGSETHGDMMRQYLKKKKIMRQHLILLGRLKILLVYCTYTKKYYMNLNTDLQLQIKNI